MGSFANGIQVRSTNSQLVTETIDELMREASYERTEQSPEPDSFDGFSSTLRALHVSDEREGWVGVLDSDLLNATTLAQGLSAKLSTYVIQFMVADSDAWVYVLFHNGETIDEFDSSGGAAFGGEFDEGDADAMASMLGIGPEGVAEFERQVLDIQSSLESDMPADLREIQRKLESGEQSTPEEAQRYGNWMQQQAEKMMGELSQLMPNTNGDSFGDDASGDPPALTLFGGVDDDDGDDGDLGDNDQNGEADDRDVESHLKLLRPILPSGAEPKAVELLTKQAIFAEQVLGEFLELLAIRPAFAQLSYQYLYQWEPNDLMDANVRMPTHLKYENAAPPQDWLE